MACEVCKRDDLYQQQAAAQQNYGKHTCEPFQLSSPEREAALDRQLYADHLAEQRLERRERIATAALQGLLQSGQYTDPYSGPQAAASDAVTCADALIAALDYKDTP